jgi:predicted dehydrogenase
MGKPVKVRSQWHKKNSWRRSSPNADREKELNWRLERTLSTGLVGEAGIHQVDMAAWYLLKKPIAVTGFGSTILWNDGRNVPDTAQAIFEYPGGVLTTFEGTLASSFDGAYDLYFGTDSTIMHRERRAWMFKEADAPLLGWEVYARKEVFYKESGIVLGANATKLAAQGDKPVQDTLADTETAPQHSLKAFLSNCALTASGVKDFNETYGSSDPKELRDYLDSLVKSRAPAAGWQEGLEATIAVIKANEAINKGTRITFDQELFALK